MPGSRYDASTKVKAIRLVREHAGDYPAQRPRIAEAEREGWLGEVEGLKISLAGANDKLTQIDRRGGGRQPVDIGFPAIPPQRRPENTMPVSP